ncbi:MAG: FAD-dependent oxidoreductase, partial [Deltaproteobacteria bacterium]|nr:FAD-dependent oxidoreductase [Deltaproteobacteria bacterium]
MIAERDLRKRGLAGNSEVAIYTPEPFPLPVTGEKMGMKVRGMLEKRGIKYFENHKITEIDPAKREMIFENGKAYTYDLLAGIPPHSAPDAVRNSPLADQSTYVPVDKHTLLTKYEDIYAIGDAAKITIAGGKALPKAGVFAHHQGEVVAERIIASIEGRNTDRKFNGDGSCVLETGGSGAGYAKGNFFTEPAPAVRMYPPFFGWHLAKIMFEKWWFWKYF